MGATSQPKDSLNIADRDFPNFIEARPMNGISMFMIFSFSEFLPLGKKPKGYCDDHRVCARVCHHLHFSHYRSQFKSDPYQIWYDDWL